MTKKSTKNTKTKGTAKAKPAAKPKTVDVDSDALLDFLAKRAGGTNKAVKAFIRETTASLVKSGATFGAIMAQAEAEGWDSVLKDTPVKSVLATPAKSAAKGPGRNGALSKLRADILDKLAGGPTAGMTAADLSNKLNVDRKRLTRQLAKLADDGKVKTAGSRRNRTYSLV